MTQRDQILQMLRDAGDRGLHSFELYEARLPRAAARIAELREAGFTITSTRERYRGQAEGVRYRLVEATHQVARVEPSLLGEDRLGGRSFPSAVAGWEDAA